MRNQISVTNLKADKIWESEVKIVDICLSILKEIPRFRVPQPKSGYLEWTDAGPGVGITNNDVHYRTAQKIRIINADYLIRLHLANGDSSHNEVERCQAYVEDAICDGGALEWEHRKLLDHKTIDDLKQMSSAELADYEIKRMTYNAYKICEEVAARIDGVPSPSGYLKGFKAFKKDEMFFNDKEFLSMYLSKSEKERIQLPGAAYYKQLTEFMDLHFEVGMKYLEFLKFDCIKKLGKACKFCEENPWVGPSCSRVPRPMPNYESITGYHYRPVNLTPTHVDGIIRPVDDFQPRKQISEAFKKGEISLTDEDSIDRFCQKYITEKKVVRACLEHVQLLELNKKRKREENLSKVQEEENKQYKDIDWEMHFKSNTLEKLKVATLNKYLENNDMEEFLKLKKPEKCELISCKIAVGNLNSNINAQKDSGEEINKTQDNTNNFTEEESDNDADCDSDSEDDDNEDDDTVLRHVGDECSEYSESDNDNSDIMDVDEESDICSVENEDDFDVANLFTTTRSGRSTKSSRCSYFKCKYS